MKPVACFPFALTAFLLACGGGGNEVSAPTGYTATCADGTTRFSSVSLAQAQGFCAPTVAPSVPIVTSIPATTYAAGSQEKAAYDYLNNARSICGFGLLAQDTKLDAAATSHSNYQLLHGMGHVETQGLSGFTGVTSTDRAAVKGFYGATSEAASLGQVVSPSLTDSINLTRALLSAPYHLRGMMEGFRSIGVGFQTLNGNFISQSLTFNFGTAVSVGKQQPADSSVLTYPCQGTTDTATLLASETPWPVPNRAAPIGQPILIQVAEGKTLVLNSYSITRLSGPGIDAGTPSNGSVAGATSPLLKLDWSNDTSNLLTGRYNVAMLMPDKTMYTSSTYRVQITGASDGVAFAKDFRFVTSSTPSSGNSIGAF